MKAPHYIAGIVLLRLMVMLLSGCAEKKEPAAGATDNETAVRLHPIKRIKYNTVLHYSGALVSINEAKLSFKTGGIVSKIFVKEGDHVIKGQLLATLNMTEINALEQQASQNVEKLTRDLNRANNLYRDTAVTLEQLQNANTGLKMASSNLLIARFNKQYAQIRATISGTVQKKFMNEGELASPGAPVFFIVGTSENDWRVRFGVADKDWPALKINAKATIAVDVYPADKFPGAISKIADTEDPVTGSYEVEVKVFPGKRKFAAGLFSSIQLQTTSQQDVSLIPVEALTESEGKTGYVYTINKDERTVTKHQVAIYAIDKREVLISNGLEQIDHVITDGVGYLTPASLVKVVR